MQKPKLYQKDEGYTSSIVEENNGICLYNSNNGKCCYIGLVFKNPGEQYTYIFLICYCANFKNTRVLITALFENTNMENSVTILITTLLLYKEV